MQRTSNMIIELPDKCFSPPSLYATSMRQMLSPHTSSLQPHLVAFNLATGSRRLAHLRSTDCSSLPTIRGKPTDLFLINVFYESDDGKRETVLAISMFPTLLQREVLNAVRVQFMEARGRVSHIPRSYATRKASHQGDQTQLIQD